MHEVVKVDVFVPGCPPPADTIFYVVSELLAGRIPGPDRHQDPLRPLRSKRYASKQITIDPVTRIEGHAKITLQLDDDGRGAPTPSST